MEFIYFLAFWGVFLTVCGIIALIVLIIKYHKKIYKFIIALLIDFRGAIFVHCIKTRKVGKQKDSQKFGFIEIKPYLCTVYSKHNDYARG